MTRTILTVDDSKTMREMVAFTLTNAGFSVVQAEHGAEGLERIKAQKVDVIVTDLNMPVMDGITFIKQVRERPEYKFTPILMLTTESDATKKDAGKAAGATGWIVKPFSPEKLIQVIEKVCVAA